VHVKYVPEGLKNGQIIPIGIIKKDDGLKSVQEVLDIMLSVAFASRRALYPNSCDLICSAAS
jgi:hypothetical protein